ncbi:MAG: MoxR family ATPase [Microthrixaceae bacterium]|nr:MoxR family ATPase [Microthrixaceae bacterium]HMT24823.1 MoxR family ATPase [Microthrixaceae bacterium]HMT60723.1 MoxR family ATPase [Microthrixaceae bacterium]
MTTTPPAVPGEPTSGSGVPGQPAMTQGRAPSLPAPTPTPLPTPASATSSPAPPPSGQAAGGEPRQQPVESATALLERVLFEMRKVIVGQDRAIERIVVSLLANGHCLLESVPGLAKTLSVETLARTVGGTFSRIQFTPDLLPADITGTRIYRTSSERFDVELGPVFANFVLADEINRAPAKVQSALLEVMAERQVTIGGTTHKVPAPFLVLATQNPIENEGVYPLPEAQRDRFLMKVVLGYPSPMEELEIVNRMGVHPPVASEVLSLEQVAALQRSAEDVYCDRAVMEYAVNLVLATRTPEHYGLADIRPFLEFGASPRASLGLVRAGRAMALMRGRSYVVPQDIFDVAPEILRHRLVLTYEALAQNVDSEHLLARVLSTVPAPAIQPSQVGGPTDAYYGTRTDAQSWTA